MQSSLQRDFETIHQALGTFIRIIAHVLLSFPLASIVSWLAIEGIGAFIVHRIPAPLPTQLLAIAFSLIFGYAIALTFAVITVISGTTKIIKFLEHEIEGETSALGKVAKIAKQQVLHL